MSIEEIRRTLYSISEHLGWVQEGMPYIMYDTDESCYLSSARNMAWNLAQALEDETDEEENTIVFENPRSVWLNVQEKKPRTGLLCTALTDKGFMCVAKYGGKNKGFIGFGDREIKNVTHWAYLPMKSTAK